MHEAVLYIRDDLGQAALATWVRDFYIRAKWRLRHILRLRAAPVTPPPNLPEAELRAQSAELAIRAAALLADDESEEQKALKNELQELKDRQWLAGIKEDVVAEICRKKEIFDRQTALRDTRQNEITKKSSALSETLVTDRLRGRFAQEIDHLNLAGLAIELRRTRTQHGVPLFRVCLIHRPETKAGQILSEGEHRCVALAAFLAELSTTDSHSGIVFDDPISSLDHLHREAVARRLADEGRHRQVIVFTHDLPFLFLLERACREGRDGQDRTEVALRHILRRADNPGFCENNSPMKAQTATRRVQSLQAHLDNTRIQYDHGPEDIWLITAKGLLGHIRDAWESAVEGAVAPVLRTFQSKVDTKGFSKLSVIELQDAEAMRASYGRCSVLLHNASDALNPAIPTPDQIGAEIDALRVWIDNLRVRQEQV